MQWNFKTDEWVKIFPVYHMPKHYGSFQLDGWWLVRQITFKIPGTPVAKARPRFVSGRAITPKKTRVYEELVARVGAIANQGHPLLTGPLRLKVEAIYAKPKSWTKKKAASIYWKTSTPDADNLAKIMDGLNGVVWKDDAQVCDLHVKKRYSDDGIEEMRVTITELRA